MKYLKRYESHEYIKSICQKYGIKNYTINDDGSIDVDSLVDLAYNKLTVLPLKFRNVSGNDFYCSFNKLTNLDGCPKSVGGDFSCCNNYLTSLQGCPKSISWYFNCRNNGINTFEGLDFVHIGGNFHCNFNPVYEVWILFHDHTKFEFFNDCDIIRENRVIILDRLNFFLDYIDKPTVTKIEGYKCI